MQKELAGFIPATFITEVIMQEILSNYQNYLLIAGNVVAAASIIASMTPNPKDDGIVKKLNAILNLLAFNVGKAKNKED